MSARSESEGETTNLLNRQRSVELPARRLAALRAFLLALEKEVARGRPFSVCLVSDRAMRRYNRRFRGKDSPTDVLAFPDGEQDRAQTSNRPPARAGDLVISAQTARRQARRLGHAVETEIRILAIHGLLHLLGHDHEVPRRAGDMARAELHWRRRFALPAGLIERSTFRRGTSRRSASRRGAFRRASSRRFRSV